MRKKEMKLVVTFHTTADAMATERVCKSADLPGRLIPVPRTISAGCGMSWCTDEALEEQLTALLDANLIEREGIFHCQI